MNFKITNSDSTKYFPSRYYEWSEKISNKNSRSFKKEFDYVEYEKIQYLWEISNYLGPAPPRSVTFFSYYTIIENNFITPKVSISSVSEHLKNNPMIDETYLPVEGDQLLIFKDYYYKQIKNVIRPDIDPKTISLLFKDNKWKKGNYRYEFDETRWIHSGVLEI